MILNKWSELHIGPNSMLTGWALAFRKVQIFIDVWAGIVGYWQVFYPLVWDHSKLVVLTAAKSGISIVKMDYLLTTHEILAETWWHKKCPSRLCMP